MREAQRRRRQRLKDQRQSFLQIILPERLRSRLMTLSEATGLTLQEAALEILAGALAPDPVKPEDLGAERVQETAPAAGGAPVDPSVVSEEEVVPAPVPPAPRTDEQAREAGQLELF